jgi:hypothetical protein
MSVDDGYDEWYRGVLADTDREVARLIDGEHVRINTVECSTCSRLKTKNVCECEDLNTECYYCHLWECHVCGV